MYVVVIQGGGRSMVGGWPSIIDGRNLWMLACGHSGRTEEGRDEGGGGYVYRQYRCSTVAIGCEWGKKWGDGRWTNH